MIHNFIIIQIYILLKIMPLNLIFLSKKDVDEKLKIVS